MGLIHAGEIAVLWGAPGTGKTSIAWHLACTLLGGQPVFGRLPATKLRRVLMLEQDESQQDSDARYEAHGRPAGLVRLCTRRAQQYLDTAEGARWLKKEVAAAQPDMLILDAIQTLCREDPAEAVVAKRFFAAVQAALSPGVSAIVLAHTNKKGHWGGSQQVLGAADVAWLVERQAGLSDEDPDLLILTPLKSPRVSDGRRRSRALEVEARSGWQFTLRRERSNLPDEDHEDVLSLLAWLKEKEATGGTRKEWSGKDNPVGLARDRADEVLCLARRLGVARLRKRRGEHGAQVWDLSDRGRAWLAEEQQLAPGEVEPATDPQWDAVARRLGLEDGA